LFRNFIASVPAAAWQRNQRKLASENGAMSMSALIMAANVENGEIHHEAAESSG